MLNNFCEGDEAGPLICNGVVIGLARWSGCSINGGDPGDPPAPGIYTEIAPHAQWMNFVVISDPSSGMSAKLSLITILMSFLFIYFI